MEEYTSIPKYPNNITAQSILVRLLDGLAFRFRWATEDLRPEDYEIRPAPDCMSIWELVRHIWGLVNWVSISMDTERFRKVDDVQLTRKNILQKIQLQRKALLAMSNEDLNRVTIDGNPFWQIINGPITDALTHVGQINSFRRLSGNPTPSANVFLGEPPES